jgi:hypothetical protein
MRRQLATFVAVAALVLGASGCSSDDGGDDDEKGPEGRDAEVAAALADVMGRNLTTENGQIASECTANSIVDQIGGDGVVEGGLLTEELEVPRNPHEFYPREVAEAVANAYVACWDVDAQVEDVQAAIPNVDPKKLKAFGDCMREISDKVIRDTYYNATIEGGDNEKAAALGSAIAACQAELS